MLSFMAALVIVGVLSMLTIATLRHLVMIAIRQRQRDAQLEAQFVAWRDAGDESEIDESVYVKLDDPDKW